MLIEIKSITKYFGKNLGVSDITFNGKEGDILGLLGQNGSGKSTTMKMIVGYLTPSNGQIFIGGYEMSQFPHETKSMIGYLPENNPLYHNMYVREYLEFMGSINGIKKNNLNHRINKLITKCGLDSVIGKKISSLSKGFKQRVGLSQALLHNPKILILDEPTTGLDPNQIIEIRNLIKDISKDKFVLISTHIMQEVDSLCNRVIILKEGKSILNETLESIKEKALNIVSIHIKEDITSDIFHEINGIKKIKKSNSNFLLYHEYKTDIREQLFNFIKSKNLTLLEMKKNPPNIEETFFNLTHST